jgi:hypothetical protein
MKVHAAVLGIGGSAFCAQHLGRMFDVGFFLPCRLLLGSHWDEGELYGC